MGRPQGHRGVVVYFLGRVNVVWRSVVNTDRNIDRAAAAAAAAAVASLMLIAVETHDGCPPLNQRERERERENDTHGASL